jgi:hypothetical protein
MRLGSPRSTLATSDASAYLALTLGNVFVFHAHAFNIALLVTIRCLRERAHLGATARGVFNPPTSSEISLSLST